MLYTERKKSETTNEVMLVYLHKTFMNMKPHDLWSKYCMISSSLADKENIDSVGLTDLPLFKVSKCWLLSLEI